MTSFLRDNIVAVHGLNGHYRNTWTDKPGSSAAKIWLSDLLPLKLPGCRVMSYEYDASVESMAVGTVRDIARRMTQEFKDKRESDVPIVFIAHSLGGIVIKQALVLAEQSPTDFPAMTEQTKGIVFFGTPHRGADAATWGALVTRIVGNAFPLAHFRFMNFLKKNSEGLYKVSEDFRHLASNYAIVSFYEEHAYNRIWGKVIVDKDSATMSLQHEDYMMLSGTHTSMCRFSEDDDRFGAVWRRIQRAVDGPVHPSDRI
ncbi:Alpha/Beta hydrolase protein [Xylaria bambusicola]|uniref:Alpha/Beta hydrolase protein n=1 Tax=Xylaria bambusicola TaxID=326684 RepID=UPI002007D962|nr:Alpha/Beta hydrolase protein [Xylaria bambusicola]KAI0523877.1 Alpha/Beta hydrolase protein [Xylaria bambusicola]